MRCIVCTLILTAAACSGGAVSTSSGWSSAGAVGGMPVALHKPVDTAKIVLKTPQTFLAQVFDDQDFIIPCTTDAQCLTGFCDVTVGDQYFHLCVTSYTQTAVAFVETIPIQGDASDRFRVPCDGITYAVEVYGATAGNVNHIDGAQVYSAPAVAFDTSCGALKLPAAGDWTPGVIPSLIAPTVYAGLGAPYDKYTLKFGDVSGPWSGPVATTVTCGGAAPNAGTAATFNAPAATAPGTNPAPIECQCDFSLAGSLALPNESPWRLTATATIHPVNTGGVGFPP